MAKERRTTAHNNGFTMMDPRVMDPEEELIEHTSIPSGEMEQIMEVLEALRAWNTSEKASSEASRRYMKLGETDMRALRYLIAAERNNQVSTPSALAQHLRISTASVTKLLDRLAAHHHIVRQPHPEDRRSTAVVVTADTQRAAREAVGRSHALRFHAAAALSPSQRAVVIDFLHSLSEPPEDTHGISPSA